MRSFTEETLTFLGTDIERSTLLLEQLGPRWEQVLTDHRRILRTAFADHEGEELGTEGDSFLVAFRSAAAAVAAAVDAQCALHAHPWPTEAPLRVRMGVHTGEARATGAGYIGLALHRAARVREAAHGGQVLVSQTTLDVLGGRLPPEVAATDLGSHRLRDLGQPVRLHQLRHPTLPDDFPPPRSLDAHPHNLPIQPTSFVGREDELVELAELLGRTRLLTLTGAGGCGKTRLALQVAAECVQDYPDGVWLCDLATAREPEDVERAVRSAVGVEPEGPRPLTEHFRHLEALLVLDNCEHLVDECAVLAEAIVTSCPGMRLLATSRESLHAGGEMAWRVPSLGFPAEDEALDDVNRHAAIRLFVDRARAADAGFELRSQDVEAVAQICRRLDGLPLALELAAARTRSLSPSDLASRLDDRFRLLAGGRRRALERQQTLRAAVDWSHDLLPEAEQVLLRRLSVFTGTFDLEAVEGVCAGEGVDADAVLDLVDHLVDANLVGAEHTPIGTRYRLLETIRQYAQERAVQAGEGAALRDRHLDYLVDWIRRLTDEPPTSDAGWDLAHAEYPNFRAAWSWARETGRESLILLLGSLMAPHWSEQGSDEGGEWTREVLEIIDAGQSDPGDAAVALATAANWARMVPHDYPWTLELVERGIPLAEQAGDERILLWLLTLKGLTLWSLKEREEVLQRAVALGRSAATDPVALAMALWGLSSVARAADDVDREREIMREAVAEADSTPSALRAPLLVDAAVVEWRAGDPRRAREIAEQAVADARYPRTMYNVAQEIAPRDPGFGREVFQRSLEMMGTTRHGLRSNVMLAIADLDFEQERLEDARGGAERALALARETGKESSLIWAESLLAEIALASGDPREARRHAEDAVRRAGVADVGQTTALYAKAGADLAAGEFDAAATAMAGAFEGQLRSPTDSAAGIHRIYERMARVEAARGRLERAATLLGRADMLRRREAMPRPVAYRPVIEELRDDLERRLGAEAYRASAERGAQMTPDDAAGFALDRQ